MVKKRRTKDRDSGGGGDFPGIDFSTKPSINEGLVPTGIPMIYKSPTEPVDPQDCENWPESPFCGTPPFNRDFMDVSPEFSINPCEVCVTFSPVLGYISLPPYTVCVRRDSPECQPPPPEPPPPPPDRFGERPRKAYKRKCADGSTIYIGIKEATQVEFVGVALPAGTEIYEVWEALEGYLIGNVFRDAAARPEAEGLSLKSEPYGIYKPLEAVGPGYTVFRLSSDGVLTDLGLNNGIIVYYPVAYNVAYTDTTNGLESLNPAGYRTEIDYFPFEGDCETIQPPPERLPPPPYKPPEKRCCMSCCRSNNRDSDELLRRIARRLGTDDYPVKVPQSLLADRGNGTEQLQSVTQLIGWFIRQFDAVAGQFPIEIEIADNDPTKQGNQKEKIKIPNLAEGIAELLGTGLGTNINTNTLINICIRTLTEAGSGKIEAIKARYIAQAIADYLAFDAEETSTPVPLTFVPGKTDLDDILVEKEQKVPLYNYKDDRDFRGEMTELLFAASIIRAVHYKKVNPYGDVKGDLINRFKDLLSQAEEKDDRGSETVKADFDDFVKQVEEGFINTPGIKDVLNPYGRNFQQRPRIRELGNTSDESSEEL